MPLETIAIQALVGVSSGMILFIVASGLSLIFGVLRVINFAHGSLYMLGAFLATSVGAWLANQSVGFFGALLIAPLLVALVGAGLEVGLFRRIYRREHLLQLLLTYGLTLIIADVVRMIRAAFRGLQPVVAGHRPRHRGRVDGVVARHALGAADSGGGR